MSDTSPTGSVEDQSTKEWMQSLGFEWREINKMYFHADPLIYLSQREATFLRNASKSMVASEVRKARVEELRALSETEWAYDEAFGGYLKERIAELEGEDNGI